MSDIRHVTVLGVGLLGSPVAVNLRRCGFDVTVWNRTAEKATTLAAEGCRPCVVLSDAVAEADAVITLLTDGAATEQVLVEGGALEAMRRDALLVQSGTIGIAATRRVAAAAAAAGITMVDAPVSGSRVPAERGELIVLAGGDSAGRALADPLLAAIGKRTLWAGGVGDGMRLKLVVQTWLVTVLEALAETVALAETAGLDPAFFLQAIADGPLDLPYAHLKGGAMRDRAFTPAFPLQLVPKDARLARELLGDDASKVAPMLDLVLERAATAIADGHGDDDMAAIFYATGRA
jgi:3-hydroxyisobutyrate dehydrogenase